MSCTQNSPTWADILDSPGYQVSDSYRVRSLDRTIEGRRGMVKGRELSTWIRSGRRMVELGRGNTVYVDDLVRDAFGADSKLQNAAKVETCSKGHDMSSASTWGRKNRVCADCAAGKPRVLELPEVL
jgi:hypothetical protein